MRSLTINYRYLLISLLFVISCTGEVTESSAVEGVLVEIPQEIVLDAYNGNCTFSKKDALESLYTKMVEANVVIFINFIDEYTLDENCWNKIMGSNYTQSAVIYDGDKLDLVVGVKFNNDVQNKLLEELKEASVDDNLCTRTELTSENYKGCDLTIELKVVKTLGTGGLGTITDIVPFKDYIYVVEKYPGRILRTNSDFTKKEIWLDKSNEIYCAPEDGGECGIWSLAFHPTFEYLLLSYSGSDNTALVEKIYIDNYGWPLIQEKDIIFYDQRSTNVHYSGQLDYSEYLTSFVYSTGDGFNDIGQASMTTSPRGKILLLESETSLNIPLAPIISSHYSTSPLNNILAYGFRNPWGITVWKNTIIVPDVGQELYEEVNRINLNLIIESEIIPYYGWPIFEGKRNQYEEINSTSVDWISKTKYYVNNESIYDGYDYLVNNVTDADFWYKHGEGPFGTRVAIIGGGVIPKGKWQNYYVYADHFANELFLMNLITNEVVSTEIKFDYGFITNIAAETKENDTFYIGTLSGEVVKVSIRKTNE